MAATRPTYQALVDAAVQATQASSGWLLADEADGMRVVATSGQAATHQELGATIEARGAKAYVLAAGQPTALLPQPGDVDNADAGGAPGVPSSLLAVPCGEDDVVGVLEVSGKAGGANFDFADISALSGLARVASAALIEQDAVEVTVASPAQLAGELTALASRNPARYRDVARIVESMLSIEA